MSGSQPLEEAGSSDATREYRDQAMPARLAIDGVSARPRAGGSA
jgi:hypothetical protein